MERSEFEHQRQDRREFDIEPLEARIAPSTLPFGGRDTAYGFQGVQNGQIVFLGYDPVVQRW